MPRERHRTDIIWVWRTVMDGRKLKCRKLDVHSEIKIDIRPYERCHSPPDDFHLNILLYQKVCKNKIAAYLAARARDL